jgi:hypothetical protein
MGVRMVWSARFGGPKGAPQGQLQRRISEEGVLPMKIKRAVTALLSLCGLGMVLASVDVGVELAQADEGDCAINYHRTACPGQEAESYKKCDGKQSCTKNVAAASAEKCVEAAVQACANDRLTVTASKVIQASYKGKALKSPSGKDDMCLDYPKRATEFNQCAKK